MAEFCRACEKKLIGADVCFNDAEGLTTEEAWKDGRAALFMCEGCGTIQVDPEGNCVSSDCFCKGQPGHGLPWIKK